MAAGWSFEALTAYLFRMMKIFPSRQPFVLLVTGTACQICFSSCLHTATITHVTVCFPHRPQQVSAYETLVMQLFFFRKRATKSPVSHTECLHCSHLCCVAHNYPPAKHYKQKERLVGFFIVPAKKRSQPLGVRNKKTELEPENAEDALNNKSSQSEHVSTAKRNPSQNK